MSKSILNDILSDADSSGDEMKDDTNTMVESGEVKDEDEASQPKQSLQTRTRRSQVPSQGWSNAVQQELYEEKIDETRRSNRSASPTNADTSRKRKSTNKESKSPKQKRKKNKDKESDKLGEEEKKIEEVHENVVEVEMEAFTPELKAIDPLHGENESEVQKKELEAIYKIQSEGKEEQKNQHVAYFVLKSFEANHLEQSLRHGCWATTPNTRPKLFHASTTHDKVVLIFSVNRSGSFQGYAELKIPLELVNTDFLWAKGKAGSEFAKGFNIVWKKKVDLPFLNVRHLTNPMNSNKPVKICRDGQELPEDLGKKITNLIDSKEKESVDLRPRSPLEVLKEGYAPKMPSHGSRNYTHEPYLPKPVSDVPPRRIRSEIHRFTDHRRDERREERRGRRREDRRKEKSNNSLGIEQMTYEEYLARHRSIYGDRV